jgi:glycosyltransferase involved in cell wall biosynthesis
MSGGIDVIIPVRNLAGQVGACLEPIRNQLGEDDRIVVVDDASTDGTADAAKALGASVITITRSRGPYYARQVAASSSAADNILFVDARCRALPGLLDRHRTLLGQPGVALSCTEVSTLSGPTLAARIAHKQQPFSLAGKIGVAGRLDFFPTANLGVRRSSFAEVGGFREMRSGADADLCWRIQMAGLGTMKADTTVLMEWAPRSSVRDLIEQWNRYGKSTAYLEWVYPDQSPTSSGQKLSIKHDLVQRFRADKRTDVMSLLPSLAYQLGIQQGRRSPKTAPTLYGDVAC